MTRWTKARSLRSIGAVLISVLLALSACVSSAYASTALPPAYKLTFFAGDGGPGYPTAGPALNSFIGPAQSGVAVDAAGNVYVADFHGFVVKITPAGNLSVIGGKGDTSHPPVPGPATSSPMTPMAIAVSATGDVYVGDYDGYVEKITPGGTLSIVAGTGYGGTPRPGRALASPVAPDGLGLDRAGNLYIADYTSATPHTSNIYWGRVLKVTPSGTLSFFAGNGNPRSVPKPGPALLSPMNPESLAVDTHGNVFIADQNNYVEKVTPAGVLSVVAGDGDYGPPRQGPALSTGINPFSIAVDGADDLFVGSGSANVVRITPSGWLLPIAGNGTFDTPKEGPALASAVSPYGIAVDAAGDVYVGDGTAFKIDKLTAATRPGAVGNPVAAARSASALVTWPAPTDTGGAVIGEYKVQASGDGGRTWWGSTYTASTRAMIGGLTPGHGYQFRVAAVNVVGQGPWSQTLATVTPYRVSFSGYIHGCVCVHQTASVSASGPSGSRIGYAWKHGSTWLAWNHPDLSFPMGWLGESIEVKMQVVTPDGVVWTKYLTGGPLRTN